MSTDPTIVVETEGADVKEESPIIDAMLDEAGFGWFQIRLCLLCSMGYFAVGSELLTMVMTQTGVMAGLDVATSLDFSWLPFCANLASLIAAVVIGKIIDKFGRKWCFIGCIATSAVFGIVCSLAPSFGWLIVFRSIVGFGLGGIAVIDYVVLVECCPTRSRNTACQIVFVSGCLGVIYVALVGFLPLSDWFAVDQWRSFMFIGGLPLLATVGLRAMVSTDTPKFLVASGKTVQAYNLLANMHRANAGCRWIRSRHTQFVTPTFCRSLSEFEEKIKTEKLATDRLERGKLRDVLTHASTIPLWGVWIVQSLVYWGLTTFLPVFLSSAGISPSHGLLAMGLAELPGVVIATLVSQHLGRPAALTLCLSLSLIGAVLTGCSVACDWPSSVLITGASLFYMFLIPIWGVLFVMTPETYPVPVRGVAVGFHHMCKSIPSLVAPFIAAAILESRLEGAFMFIWAGVLLVGIALSVWLRVASPHPLVYSIGK